MFLAFDPFTLFLLIFACFFLPGILIALAVLKGERLNIIEKAFIGMGIGFTVPQLLPFLAYFIFGVKYTYSLALITVAIFWLLAIALTIIKRTDQDVIETAKRAVDFNKLDKYRLGLNLFLILLVILAFWIRFGTYSPVFQELDPYYYTYIAQQIITDGYNPFDDQTAWYPDLKIDHRSMPVLSYMESLWYSLYNGSNQYDNMLLAVIAGLYPPIAAMLSVFFFYLLLSRMMKTEYALIGAGIASFAPSFLFKTIAGEMEVQPYAFFALPMFYALYLLMLQEKKMIYAVLSGLAFVALTLGSSSEVLATNTLIIFWLVYALFIFIKDTDAEEIKQLIMLNIVSLGIGVLLGSAILRGLFFGSSVLLRSLVPAVIILAILGALYYIQKTRPKFFENRKQAVAVIAIVLFLLVLSPLGEPIKEIGRGGLGVTQYSAPLLRTIAEQGMAGSSFSSEIGFVASSYNGITNTLLSPLTASMSSDDAKKPITGLADSLGTALSWIFMIFYIITNLAFNVSISALNFVLGTNVTYSWKDNTLLMVWPVLMVAAAINYIYRKRDSGASEVAAVLFLLAAVLPPFLVGILKAKYTIYAAYFIGAGIAFVLSELEIFIGDSNWVKNKKTWQSAVLYFGAFLLVMQFFHGGFASSLAVVNFQTRFQDDPLATQVRLQQICDDTKDAKICAVAKDPVAYASGGTTKQYDTLLCMLTALPDYKLYLDPGKSMATYQAAGMRCNRLTDYWINSMEWIRYNTENGSRTTSWWDYGHWINYFGQKNAVLRNEHASTEMIGEVAFAYTEGDEADLINFMKDHDSKYALFDAEIVGGSGGFGGKYGALNYLGCAYANKTDVSKSPGQSTCEADNLWEMVYVSGKDGCKISDSGPNGTVIGAVAYTVKVGPPNGEWYYNPYYPGECTGTVNDANTKYYCSYYIHLIPTYCVGNVELADGETITGTYYLNETYPNGDLKVNKGLMAYPFSVKNTYNAGDLTGVTMLYTKEKIWLENGQIVDGFSDHKGDFYDSNIYKGFVLGQIDGFDKVYDDGAVKIFKMKE